MSDRIKYLILMFFLLLSGCWNCKSNLQLGIENFQVQDYRSAFVRLMSEAHKGNPDAQYAVGYMFYYGLGVIEDRKKAWYWIKCAAKAGQRDAIAARSILTAT